jgi:hypothetical protein
VPDVEEEDITIVRGVGVVNRVDIRVVDRSDLPLCPALLFVQHSDGCSFRNSQPKMARDAVRVWSTVFNYLLESKVGC